MTISFRWLFARCLQALEQGEGEIGIEMPLMKFVEDDGARRL